MSRQEGQYKSSNLRRGDGGGGKYQYRVRVEQWDSLMFQVFPKSWSGGRDKTLEAPAILGFHGNWVLFKGGDKPVAGVQLKGRKVKGQQ